MSSYHWWLCFWWLIGALDSYRWLCELAQLKKALFVWHDKNLLTLFVHSNIWIIAWCSSHHEGHPWASQPQLVLRKPCKERLMDVKLRLLICFFEELHRSYNSCIGAIQAHITPSSLLIAHCTHNSKLNLLWWFIGQHQCFLNYVLTW